MLYNSKLLSRISILITLLFFTITLSSCGFHPRGPLPIAPPLRNIYLKTSDPYGQLARDIRQYFALSYIHVTSNPRNASTILEILNEETGQQLLSVGGSQQTRQYNLTLTVTFEVTDPNCLVLIPPQSVIETRTIPVQANQVLAASNEATQLYNQMRIAIVSDILNRLSSTCATLAVTRTCICP